MPAATARASRSDRAGAAPAPALEVARTGCAEKDTCAGARDPDRGVPSGRRPRRARRTRSPRSACRRCSRPGGAATTARARRSCARRDDVDIGVVAARRRAADPRGARAVHARAVDHRGARASTARSRCWPVVENVHRDGILRAHPRACAARSTTRCSARPKRASCRCSTRSTTSVSRASSCSTSTATCSPTRSRLAVHNCGHWTIEGAETSQFENHLRAVLGWPLGSTARARRRRDGQLHRRDARPRRGARGPRRAPARLRQGTAARTQARARHRRRRPTPHCSKNASQRVMASVT